MGPRHVNAYGDEPEGTAPPEFPELSGLAKGAPSSLLEESWLSLPGEQAKTSPEEVSHKTMPVS